VTGLSEDPSSHIAHAAFCTDDSTKYAHQGCYARDFSSSDNRGTTATGDWDFGFYKGECGANEYVAGVSQRTNGAVDSILCCQGAVSHSACAARRFSSSDSREDSAAGDWDYGFYKGECGPGRYVAGVSRVTSSGRPDAILCCQ
jgi:hypothetical protein